MSPKIRDKQIGSKKTAVTPGRSSVRLGRKHGRFLEVHTPEDLGLIA